MPGQKPDVEKVSLRMESIWMDAENRIIQDVIRRIKKCGKITSTADYQINRLIELGKSTEEVERILKDALDATYPEMYELYDEVANWQYVRNKDIYEQINGTFIPPEENEWMIQISEAIKKQFQFTPLREGLQQKTPIFLSVFCCFLFPHSGKLSLTHNAPYPT